jgi:hypothetical protein
MFLRFFKVPEVFTEPEAAMTGPSVVPGNVDFRSSDRPELHRILWLTLG